MNHYNETRTHLSLDKNSSLSRAEQFAQWKKGGPIKTETFRRLQDEVWGEYLW